MELICVETYNDIRFTLRPGDSTSLISYLTEKEIAKLIKDYPEKFKVVDSKRSKAEDTEEGFKVEFKEPVIETRKVKLTKK